MSPRFAGRHRAVVAGHTSAWRNTRMTVRRRNPPCGAMTTIARSTGGRYMLVGFCCCTEAVTRHVASCAIPRCPPEHALDVTGFAAGQNVRARQVKSGFEMVKLCGACGPSRLRRSKMCHGKQWQNKNQANQFGRTENME